MAGKYSPTPLHRQTRWSCDGQYNEIIQSGLENDFISHASAGRKQDTFVYIACYVCEGKVKSRNQCNIYHLECLLKDDRDGIKNVFKLLSYN